MGVWAVGSFESDTALNWLEKLYDSGDFSLVRTALSADFATAEIHVGREAIAAADLVACWLGKPPPEQRRKGLVEGVIHSSVHTFDSKASRFVIRITFPVFDLTTILPLRLSTRAAFVRVIQRTRGPSISGCGSRHGPSSTVCGGLGRTAHPQRNARVAARR